jgi:hypothetical protein
MSLSHWPATNGEPHGRLAEFCHQNELTTDLQQHGLGQIGSSGCSSAGKSWSCWVRIAICIFVCAAVPPQLLAIGLHSTHSSLTLLDRTVTQDQGAWIIDYRLRHTGKTGVIITPEEIEVRVEGWVSNSRIASHAIPRWSSLIVSNSHEAAAVSEVIVAADEAHRCRDRLTTVVWTDDQTQFQFSGVDHARTYAGAALGSPVPAAELYSLQPISLGPGSIVHVRLRLEHQHILYGDYDPLLSVRAVTLKLGSRPVRDVVPMDREQYLAQPRFSWHEPPEERRDTRHAVSGADSLHLEAHVPGHQYYRYPERPVRYNSKLRLRFWYLIAAGTEGECRVRVAQFKDTPTSWRILNSGGFEQCLKTVGHWTKVDRVLQTEPEATTLTLEFKIVGDTEVGEMWIDDVSLEPIDGTTPGRP